MNVRMTSLLAPIDAVDQPLLSRAREVYTLRYGGSMDELKLRDLTCEFGTDMATAVLYTHFEALCLAHQSVQRPCGDDRRPLLLAIAPGAFYQQHPEVGANGRELLELSGLQPWDCELILSESLGTVSANAHIINQFLDERRHCYRVVLVSLSKGTADAVAPQRLRPELFDSLTAWVSVSGVWHGTLMSDWLLDKWFLKPITKLMLWRHSVTQQPIEDLRYRPSSLEGRAWNASLPLYHVTAFPLRRHLSCRRARLWHRRFRQHGPNDSVVLLEDLLRLPGSVIPVWGSDHYLQGSWNAARVVSELVSQWQPGRAESAAAAHNPVSSAAGA